MGGRAGGLKKRLKLNQGKGGMVEGDTLSFYFFCVSVRKMEGCEIPGGFAPIASHLSFSPQKRSWRINKQKGESEKEEFLSFSISFSTFLPSLLPVR